MKLYYNALKETTLFSVSIERVRQKIIEKYLDLLRILSLPEPRFVVSILGGTIVSNEMSGNDDYMKSLQLIFLCLQILQPFSIYALLCLPFSYSE